MVFDDKDHFFSKPIVVLVLTIYFSFRVKVSISATLSKLSFSNPELKWPIS